MITKICKYCGNDFDTYKAWERNGKAAIYCSKACACKGNPRKPSTKVKLKCIVCDKEYFVKNYRKDSSKCCSRDCLAKYRGKLISGENHPCWKGGISKRPYKVRIWSKLVKERDGYKCIKCDSIENLEAHHIEEFSTNEELRYQVSNGITLCLDCHSKEHKDIELFIRSKNVNKKSKEKMDSESNLKE